MPPPQQKTPNVFLSFAKEDEAVADAVRQLLIDELGLDESSVFMWSERAQSRAGREWMQEIRKALEVVQVYVGIFSYRALQRPWVNFEAGAAWIRGIPIIPCCLGRIDKGNLPAPYSNWQGINLKSEAYDLVKAVVKELGRPPAFGPFFRSYQAHESEQQTSGLLSVYAAIASNPYARLTSAIEDWERSGNDNIAGG